MPYLLLLALLLLLVADAITKSLLIARGHEQVINPFTRLVIHRIGTGIGLVLPKAALLAILAYLAINGKMHIATLVAICAFYGIVVWRNWQSIPRRMP